MVTDTESHTDGYCSRSSATTLPFPTPEGPDSTVRRASEGSDGRRCSTVTACFYLTPVHGDAKPLAGVVTKLGQQQAALVLPETTQPAAFRDVQALHDL